MVPEGNAQAKPHRPRRTSAPEHREGILVEDGPSARRFRRRPVRGRSVTRPQSRLGQCRFAALESTFPDDLPPDADRTTAAYLRQVFAVIKTGRGPTALCLQQREKQLLILSLYSSS